MKWSEVNSPPPPSSLSTSTNTALPTPPTTLSSPKNNNYPNKQQPPTSWLNSLLPHIAPPTTTSTSSSLPPISTTHHQHTYHKQPTTSINTFFWAQYNATRRCSSLLYRVRIGIFERSGVFELCELGIGFSFSFAWLVLRMRVGVLPFSACLSRYFDFLCLDVLMSWLCAWRLGWWFTPSRLEIVVHDCCARSRWKVSGSVDDWDWHEWMNYHLLRYTGRCIH